MRKFPVHRLSLAALLASAQFAASFEAQAQTAAKKLFGAQRVAAAMPAAVYGSYAKGCLAGGMKLPDDGPNWQAMRLSRNRHWAHPELISLVKKLSIDGKKVGWNGLLVGDLTQPRGGPMLSGHASHQAGLDADIWLTPMPNRRLSRKEREQLSATSMLARDSKGKLTHQKIDKLRFSKSHVGIIRTAAQYGNVERIFVHPAIKRELCQRYPNKPNWLRKIRAQYGHHYHFHIRIGCPAGSPGCKPQARVPSYGCDKKTFDWWFKVAYGPRPKPKPGTKPPKPRKKREITLRELPRQCRVVLNAGAIGTGSGAASLAAIYKPSGRIAKPTPRPVR